MVGKGLCSPASSWPEVAGEGREVEVRVALEVARRDSCADSSWRGWSWRASGDWWAWLWVVKTPSALRLFGFRWVRWSEH